VLKIDKKRSTELYRSDSEETDSVARSDEEDDEESDEEEELYGPP